MAYLLGDVTAAGAPGQGVSRSAASNPSKSSEQDPHAQRHGDAGEALRRVVAASNQLDINMSPQNGYLTGVGVEGVAALGETAKALGETPAEVASGVDSYTGIQSGLASA